MEYREVLQGYLGEWEDEQEEEVRQEAINYVASEAGKCLFDGESLVETEVIEDLVDGKENAQTEQLRSAFMDNCYWDFPPEKIREKAERLYAEQKAEEALEDYDQWRVETSFKSDQSVEITLPNALTFEVVSQFQDYDGHVTLRAEINTSERVEPENEEKMKNQLGEPEEWDAISIYPHLQFKDGQIFAQNHELVIQAEQYTTELEDILEDLGL